MRTRLGTAAALAIVLGIGCGTKPDPETDVLASGVVAVVASDPGTLELPNGRDLSYLQPGTRVRVGVDPGAGAEAPVERKVKVVVETGEHAGEAGSLPRYSLRPVAQE